MKRMKLMEIAMMYPMWLCKDAQKCIQEFWEDGWVAYSADPHFPATTDNGMEYIYPSKKEAIEDLSCCYMDGRKHKTVYRIEPGNYRYFIPDCDSRENRHDFAVERLSKENRKQLLEKWLLHIAQAPGEILSDEAPEDLVVDYG